MGAQLDHWDAMANGVTAVDLAANNGHTDVVKILRILRILTTSVCPCLLPNRSQ